MKILDRLPIAAKETFAFVREERVRLKESEIILWMSVSAPNATKWNPTLFSFPVILDTGHTHNFAIQQQHLVRWAGIPSERLPVLGHLRHSGKRMPLHAANLWLHHNQPGTMTIVASPVRLIVPRGIAVYPDHENYPRLPLLGLRAILGNNLHLSIDGKHGLVTLRTQDWRTRLLRWLA